MLNTGVDHHFVCHFTVCYTQFIMHSSADVSGWWAADARAKRTGARPSSAVVKTGRRMVLTYTLVRLSERVERESFPMQDEPERLILHWKRLTVDVPGFGAYVPVAHRLRNAIPAKK
jgi:hypothetical protein